MCMIDDGDPAQVYTYTRPRARKTYRCDECHAAISPGETYLRVSMLYDGFWSLYRTCWGCLGAVDWLTEQCGGFCHGGLWEDLKEHWDEGHEEDRLELGRQVVLMRRRMLSQPFHGSRA